MTREEQEISLTPKVRDLLEFFLENPGRLLSHDEITGRVWPDVAVTDDSIRFQILELRKALGDEGEGFVRTVPREGYRWDGPVQRVKTPGLASKPAALRLVLENREVELDEGENVIGRGHDSVLWIDHTAVSRHHARILVSGDTALIEDLGSKNGTLVGGEPVSGRVPLSDGDEIRIGPATMTFRSYSRVGSTETQEKSDGG
jgi:DNA-binding winged helix-turn-helix (wHTH) protein